MAEGKVCVAEWYFQCVIVLFHHKLWGLCLALILSKHDAQTFTGLVSFNYAESRIDS